MCLALPGRVVSIHGDDPTTRTAKVDFSGALRDVSLAFLTDVKIGEYVIVHVGMALSKVDPAEAKKIIDEFTAIEGYSEEQA